MNSPGGTVSALEELVESIIIGDHIFTPQLRLKTHELFVRIGEFVNKYTEMVAQVGQAQADLCFTLKKSCFEHKDPIWNERGQKVWDALRSIFDVDGNNEIDAFEFQRMFVKETLKETYYKQTTNIKDSKSFVQSMAKFRRAFEENYNYKMDVFEEQLKNVSRM